MITMKDIAKEAGVSHGTVSNVLNKTGKVSVEKIKLVEEAAKKLGYIPNSQAQSLRQGSASSIALIIPSLKDDAALDLYSALQFSLTPYGYDVVIYNTDDVAANEELILKKLPLSNLLAVVTFSAIQNTKPEESPYASIPCPIIFVNRGRCLRRNTDSFISFKTSLIGQDLSAHIQKNSYKNVAFFSSPSNISSSKEILDSIRSRLSNTDITIRRFTSDINLALSKAFDILMSGTTYDVIIANNMLRANAVLNAIELLNIKSPPQVIVLSSLTHMPSERLLTYELDYSKIGKHIANILIESIQNHRKPPKETFLTPAGFPFMFLNLNKTEHQTLTLLTLDTPSTNALRKLVPLFEKASGIHLKIVSMPHNDLHQQISMLNETHYYDLIRMDIAQLDAMGKSTYQSLKTANINARFSSSKPIFDLNSKSPLAAYCEYALPFDPSTQIFLYRKDLFENATVCRAFYEKYHHKLSIPTTMDEYLRIAEFFTQAYNAESPTKYGTCLTNGSASVAASDFLPYFLEELSSADTQDSSSRKDRITSALNRYCRMTRYAPQQSWWADNIREFSAGQAAMTIVYSNYASEISNTKHSNILGKVGSALIPGKYPLIGGGVIGISKYSSKQEVCRQFFNWYYSADVASLLIKLGGVSPLAESYTDTKYFNFYPWFPTTKENFELGTRGLYKEEQCTISQFEFALGTAVRNVVSGTMTTEEAYTYILPYLSKVDT